MVRHIVLSGSYCRHTANLITSHRSGEKEICSMGGSVGSTPEQEKQSVHWALLYKKLIRPAMDV
jgi:hypothetical protein